MRIIPPMKPGITIQDRHPNVARFQKILVYGVCGSGKTTLAKKIAEITQLPFHSADDMAWLPGWVMTSPESQRQKIADIMSQDQWVLDTAYGTWLDLVINEAQVVVCLDYPRWFSFWRLVKRTVSRAIDKKPVCNGNVETWRQTFSRDSILVWHFRSFQRKRRRIREWQEDPNRETVVFKSAQATEIWLKRLEDLTVVSQSPKPDNFNHDS